MSPLQNGSDRSPLPDCPQLALAVTEASGVGEARRAAAQLAGRLGFDEPGRGRVSLVVTEAATNLVKHGGGGDIVLMPVEQGDAGGLEILALDRGPGMADLTACLRDGYSSAGTPGGGLGAIGRLSGLFEVHTAAGKGTALRMRLWSRPVEDDGRAGTVELGAVHLPAPRETVCGDGWAVEERDGRVLILVADGLGHGPIAAEAAREAVKVFRRDPAVGPAELLRAAHAVLRGTRGAAVAVADLDTVTRELRFAGVGNIAGTIFADGASRSTVSHNGTVGHELRKVQEFAYPFPPGSLLVMHSDGLATHWRLEQYAGLASRSPGLIAGVLFRDFKRGRDDVTVVAVRVGGPA